MSPPDLGDVARAWCRSRSWTFVAPSGSGAFKETFRVVDAMGRPLALKIFRGNPSSGRTDRELAAMRRCSSPAIVRLHGVGSLVYAGEQFLVATEPFIEGGTLQDHLVKRRLPLDELLLLGDRLVSALDNLEDLELVHRDIKPENIMLAEGRVERATLVDFGLVRDLGATSLTETFFMRGPGTPLYASPEQLNNDKAIIGPTSDQYSLGIVLAIASTGVHPFDPSGSDFFELVRLKRQRELEVIVERMAQRGSPVTDLASALPESVSSVIKRMLLPWPVVRYMKADTLLSAWSDARRMFK